MFAGIIHDLINLGFGNLVCIDPANTDAAPVDMKHNLRGFLPILTEKPFQDMNNEVHWRKIVI